MYNNFRFPERQLEINRVGNYHITLPHAIPYRLNAYDFVFFNYPKDFPDHLYHVIVESMSNASPNHNDRFRDIGKLEQKVELPEVYYGQGFGSHSSLLVLPIVDEKAPKFIANLIRGATYRIDPDAQQITVQGHIAMDRTGGWR